jgi:hypothetical protein
MNFESSVTNEFQFLESKWGFTRGPFMEDRWHQEVIYKNETTGVHVVYERREDLLLVWLYRLVNGEPPVYTSVGERYRDETNNFSLLNLVRLRVTPDEFSNLIARRDRADLQGKCHELAQALELYAADVLAGDFSIFPELGKIMRERRETYRASQ